MGSIPSRGRINYFHFLALVSMQSATWMFLFHCYEISLKFVKSRKHPIYGKCINKSFCFVKVKKRSDFSLLYSPLGTNYFGGDKPGMLDYMIWPWVERLYLLRCVSERKFDEKRSLFPNFVSIFFYLFCVIFFFLWSKS